MRSVRFIIEQSRGLRILRARDPISHPVSELNSVGRMTSLENIVTCLKVWLPASEAQTGKTDSHGM